MKLNLYPAQKPRIEMLPLIDTVFLLLVFFIYAMLSMAVHRGLPVILPTSTSAQIDKQQLLSVTVRSDGTLYVDKEQVAVEGLARFLKIRVGPNPQASVLLFGDKHLSYQQLFAVLDQIHTAGIYRVSLQAGNRQRQ